MLLFPVHTFLNIIWLELKIQLYLFSESQFFLSEFVGSLGPDPLDNFFVRFHYYGSFQQVDGKLDYIGELVAEIFIPRDNLSYRELCNYAEDMYQVERGHGKGTYTYKLDCLPLGENLNDGLMFICDDESVKTMDIGTIDSYADVFF